MKRLWQRLRWYKYTILLAVLVTLFFTLLLVPLVHSATTCDGTMVRGIVGWTCIEDSP